MKPTPLTLAVRAYPATLKPEQKKKSARRAVPPDAMLVFDTETRTDATQRLMFGSYRYYVKGRLLEEGLFHADDVSPSEHGILKQYAAANSASGIKGSPPLRLISLAEFLGRFYKAAYKGRCLVVGFNLPFDLSRLGFDAAAARGRFAGGFSLGLWSHHRDGGEVRNQFRPRIGIKHIDSKRALKGFTARNSPDVDDLIPDQSPDGKPEKGYIFRGHFLDLRTLAFALADRGFTLEGACDAFGVEHGKQKAAQHGEMSAAYIDYNRRDVLATAELAFKLMEEYAKHPIELQATKAYSPASIGKAYLKAMGIQPVLERQCDFPQEYLGFAQTAFFGGRTSAHIRKVPVPVVYTDFISMYPTVNALMGLWGVVIAERIRVIEHCGADVESWLRQLTPEKLFHPQTWRGLAAFVQVIPERDILPARAKYNPGSNDWQIGLNHLYGDAHNAVWFSLPDVAASAILTGRVPQIVDAFRIEPVAVQKGLKPTKLGGVVDADPLRGDFFKKVIEERKRTASRSDMPEVEKERLGKSLKVLANSTSYGIYAEMNRIESDEQVKATCHGIDCEPFTCRVAHPDVPGAYCFPPLAALITGAARLMLALLEHSVAGHGGTYAMEDTDSMAIVATERGGLVPCLGGPCRVANGNGAIKALSWKQVEDIAGRFSALNPYDRSAIPGSVLKIEDDNFEPGSKRQRQLYCHAISAKRYALFIMGDDGEPALLRRNANSSDDHWSEHGLGHLLNPSDPESEDRAWIAQVWLRIIRRALGMPTGHLTFERAPAIGRVSISSPAVLKAFNDFNRSKPYSSTIKPFNFLLSAHVRPFGHPVGTAPERFHLIAPYEPDSRKWLTMSWLDQYTGAEFRITTTGNSGGRRTARVKTYGELVREYEHHPEPKCADAGGAICGKQTIGLLQRRHVRIDALKYIGKESNSLEAVQEGSEGSAEVVYTEYADPRRDEWETKIRPALRKMSLRTLVEKTGMSRRALMDLRAGRSRPRAASLRILKERKALPQVP